MLYFWQTYIQFLLHIGFLVFSNYESKASLIIEIVRFSHSVNPILYEDRTVFVKMK